MLPIVAAVVTGQGLPQSRLVNVAIPNPKERTQVFENIAPGFDFTEAIASWNVADAAGTTLKIEIRANGEGYRSKWYTIATWSLDRKVAPRESLKKQADEFGTVQTDTLELKRAAKSVDLRLTFTGASYAKLKLLTVCFTRRDGGVPSSNEKSVAWGTTIEVPQRAQGNYPNGGVLCSATSTSMMLWHYSNQLGRPELDHDVPEVQESVWDTVYKGAGNWPFNTAYFGSFPGLVGYVSRFGSIGDLEAWIAAGHPVVCSVSFDLIRGRELSPTESGHLVVLVGFTSDGDPVFNDPARKDQVRYVYHRADFERAWLYSKRTVYVYLPEGVAGPKSNGAWIGP